MKSFVIWDRSLDSSIGIGIGYGLDDRGLILGRGKIFFSSPQCPEWRWDPPSLLSNEYQRLFPRGKTAEA
jgi:hypothetical protein